MAGDALAATLVVLIGTSAAGRGIGSSWLGASVALAPLVVVLVFTAYGLYRISRLSPAQEFRRLFGAIGVSVIVLGLTVNLLSDVASRGSRVPSLGAEWIGLTWVGLLVAVMVERKIWHRVIARLRMSGELAFRTLVVGADGHAYELASRLATMGVGYRAIGLVEVGPEASGVTRLPGGPEVLGGIDDLARIIERTGAECLFIVASTVPPETIAKVLQIARRRGLEVRISASMPEILVSRLSLQTIGGTLAMSLDAATLSGSQVVVKRAFDLIVGSATILLTSPVWAVAACAIKLTSRGPILFRQERVGRHGNTITIHKFRTMVDGAERQRDELLTLSSGPLFKLEADPRLTRVGRFLRRWSIDELPQLLDVIRGEMSLVGPRPLIMFDRNELEDWHLQRLEVLPGLTGLWQVSGRSDLSFDECVKLDLFYIENWSITYDLYILLKTIPAVLRRRGAY